MKQVAAWQMDYDRDNCFSINERYIFPVDIFNTFKILKIFWTRAGSTGIQ